MNTRIFLPNETTQIFDKMNKVFYLCGLKDFWVTDVMFPKKFVKFYDKITLLIHLSQFFFASSAVLSFFTQKHLTEKQAYDQSLFEISIPVLSMFHIILVYHKVEIRELFYQLAVVLREHYNDKEIEQQMIKKLKRFFLTMAGTVTMIIGNNGLNAMYHVIADGDAFVTVIPAWPDVHDRSVLAGVVRVIFYFCWWIVAARVMATTLIILSMMITVCYQFINLQSYFYSLDNIFSEEGLNQIEKEIKFEQAFKLGIKMHSLSLRCVRQHKRICREIFSIQTFLYTGMLLTQLITLMGAERNVMAMLTVLPLSLGTLVTIGVFMWNGGDITVEASNLSEAIYFSGWHNCYGQSSVRIRKLAVIAMRQAQEPVVYKTLGVLEFSYEAYVQVVKMPYTLVSVFY